MKVRGAPLTSDRPDDTPTVRDHRATLRALIGAGTEEDWRAARRVLDSDAVQRATEEILSRQGER